MDPRRWGHCSATTRGAQHERKGLPNQDHLTLRAARDGLEILVAVADGHGSPHNCRSELGAMLATHVAVDLLAETLHRIGPEGPTSVKRTVEALLPVRISQAWASAVRRELLRHPLTEEELARVREQEGDRGLKRLARNPLSAYGSTLLCALVSEDFVAYLQIGDGDIFELRGDEVRSPLPEDVRNLANETASLCEPRAWRSFRHGFRRLAGNPPEAILLATDGYTNSFADDRDCSTTTSALFRSLRADGPGRFQEHLPGWLATASRQGSGDDITLALLFRQDTLETTP
jgi:serine/threonine protein phosphatase PrpC